jgi:hypothetical protein
VRLLDGEDRRDRTHAGHIEQHIATVARLHRADRYNRGTDHVEQVTGQRAQAASAKSGITSVQNNASAAKIEDLTD